MAMKEFKVNTNMAQPKPIAIDLGSKNLKMVGNVNGELKFKKIKSLATTDSISDNYVVSTPTRTLYFGTGKSLIQQDKTNREYIEETILLAAHQIYGSTGETLKIDLALGLPLDLYKSENKYESFNMKLKNIQSNTIAGSVNGEDMMVKINSIKICAEGYSAFMSLHEKMDATSPFMVVDVGFRTTDILSIDIEDDGEMVIGNYDTINYGMFEVFDDIKKAFMNDTGSVIPADSIEDRILYSPMIKVGFEMHDLRNWIKYGKETIKEVLKQMQLRFPDAPNRNIYLVGGGSHIANQIVEHMIEQNELNFGTLLIGTLDELIYSNVAGYYMQIER